MDMRKSFAGCERGIACLAELGVKSVRNTLCEELAGAFRDAFDVKFEEKKLSTDELVRFNTLRRDRYATDRWNLQGMGK